MVELGWHVGVEGPLKARGNDVRKSHGVKQLIKLHGPVSVEFASQTTWMLGPVLKSQDITTQMQ